MSRLKGVPLLQQLSISLLIWVPFGFRASIGKMKLAVTVVAEGYLTLVVPRVLGNPFRGSFRAERTPVAAYCIGCDSGATSSRTIYWTY